MCDFLNICLVVDLHGGKGYKRERIWGALNLIKSNPISQLTKGLNSPSTPYSLALNSSYYR